MPILDSWTIQLTTDDVLRAQGANPAQVRQRSPAMVEVAGWAVQESLPLLQPQVLYQEFTIQSMTHERIYLEARPSTQGRLYVAGPLVAEHLHAASRVVAMLCTIGPQLEEVTAALIRDDLMRGLAMDAAGSAAAEILATCASRHFETQAAAEGWQSSLPLNPGMVGWTVPEGQSQIFTLLAGEMQAHPEFKMQLSETSLMIPQKTISLVLGLGAELHHSGRICDFCSLQDTCRYQNPAHG